MWLINMLSDVGTEHGVGRVVSVSREGGLGFAFVNELWEDEELWGTMSTSYGREVAT